ncbi:MAG: hypothetical protein ACK45Y_07235 [Betaproteobacteria bacterium]
MFVKRGVKRGVIRGDTRGDTRGVTHRVKYGNVQPPESERAARIHGKKGTSEIGFPITPLLPPSTSRAIHQLFMQALQAGDAREPHRALDSSPA